LPALGESWSVRSADQTGNPYFCQFIFLPHFRPCDFVPRDFVISPSRFPIGVRTFYHRGTPKTERGEMAGSWQGRIIRKGDLFDRKDFEREVTEVTEISFPVSGWFPREEPERPAWRPTKTIKPRNMRNTR